MEIINSEKNCLGTMSFTLKIGKMRRAEEFTTYPISKRDSKAILYLQSGHRWAELNLHDGSIIMSARRAQYANSMWLVACKVNGTAEHDQCTEEQLQAIKEAVRYTASAEAGTNGIVYCDNSGADEV